MGQKTLTLCFSEEQVIINKWCESEPEINNGETSNCVPYNLLHADCLYFFVKKKLSFALT